MALFRRRAAAPAPAPSAPPVPAPVAPPADPPRIDELSDAELRWIESLRRSMAGRTGEGGPADVAALYDSVRNGWWRTEPAERRDPNPLVNGLGVVLGDALIAAADLRWVLATDSVGAELAVTDGDLLVHPVNVIAKRWGDEHSGEFITDFAAAVMAHVRTRA